MVSAFLKKLMFARQFDIDEGKVTVLGQSLVMFPADLIFDLQEMDPQKIYDHTKDQTGKLITQYLGKLGSSQAHSEAVICDLFNNFGLGKLNIIENSEATTVVKVTESTMAIDYMKNKGGYTDHCVCLITSAVLAGFFSGLKSRNLDAKETECHAKRDPSCKFVIQ